MKERKSAKVNVQQHQQQQLHQNGHLSPFKFAKLFDPDASWDKVVQSSNLYALSLSLS